MQDTRPHRVTRFYRRLDDGSRVLAVRRREDDIWHAEEIGADGRVTHWAYAPTLVSALDELDLAGDQPSGEPAAADEIPLTPGDTKHPPRPAIGEGLRQARLRQSLSVSGIAAATAIPERYLVALEDERFEVLPEGLYRRSFLRSYADFLGLDGDSYASEYARRLAPSPPAPPGDHIRRIGIPQLAPVPVWTRAVLVAVVGLVAIAAWTLQRTNPIVPVTAGAPVHHPHGSPRPAATAQPTASVSPTPQPALELSAVNGRCWLEVRLGGASGPVIYERTLQQGTSVRFGLHRSLWIRLGAPGALHGRIGTRSITGALARDGSSILVGRDGIRAEV